MTDDQIREAGRRLAGAWLAARSLDAYPEALRARARNADNGAGIGFVFGPAVADWRRHDLRNLLD